MYVVAHDLIWLNCRMQFTCIFDMMQQFEIKSFIFLTCVASLYLKCLYVRVDVSFSKEGVVLFNKVLAKFGILLMKHKFPTPPPLLFFSFVIFLLD